MFVVSGLGMACMEPITVTMLGNYFDKRRGFANSIANSGGSLGGLLFAPLLTAMFDNYGYSGAMLLCGGLYLQVFITAALFRSQSFYTKQERKATVTRTPNTKDNNSKENIVLVEKRHIINEFGFKDKKSHISENLTKSCRMERREWTFQDKLRKENENGISTTCTNAFDYDKSSTGRRNESKYNDHSRDKVLQLKCSSDYLGGSQYDMPALISSEFSSERLNGKTKPNMCNRISEVFDLSVFKNPVFITIFFGTGLLCSPHALSMMYIAPHAKDLGVSSAAVAQFLTIYSAVDLCSRLIVAAIADRNWIRRSTMIAIGSCIIGIMAHFMIFFINYTWFVLYAVLFGLFGGIFFSLYPVVIVDYLSLARLQGCLGFTILSQAIFVSCAFAVLGKYGHISPLDIPTSEILDYKNLTKV